jgi:hypothetical protein
MSDLDWPPYSPARLVAAFAGHPVVPAEAEKWVRFGDLATARTLPKSACRWMKWKGRDGWIVKVTAATDGLLHVAGPATNWPDCFARLRAHVAWWQSHHASRGVWWTAADVDALEQRVTPLWRRTG